MITKLFKTAFRVAVIGGIGVGTLAVASHVIGDERTHAVISKVQHEIHEHLDAAVDDPTALRAQLRKLEQTYPERISQLSGDVAEVDEQISRALREQAIAERVVELADRDLEAIDTELSALGTGSGLRTASTLASKQLAHDTKQLETRQSQIQQTRMVYSSRVSETDREIEYLEAQRERLADALTQLQTEQAQFQAQLVAIERQVDAIARNERLIEMMEKRQKTLDELNRYQAASLDHLMGRLSEIKSRQEAELDVLSSETRQVTYEELARMELDDEARAAQVFEDSIGAMELVPSHQ